MPVFATLIAVIMTLLGFFSGGVLPLTPTTEVTLPEIVETQTHIENVLDIEKEYDGYVCLLDKVGDNSIDVYIRPNEDCALQAFDIYLDTEGHSFEVESYTGYNIDTIEGHYNLQSIANGLEMPMTANKNYKIATITVQGDSSYFGVKVVRVDLAIAHTPAAPEVDSACLEFDPIIIGK